ncbi:MAG: hypothetical protein HGB34_00100 [Candidatus Moranbacteria bacterium]|nr:hypothetical protein [Candidatus Moranbacteria bacterium]
MNERDLEYFMDISHPVGMVVELKKGTSPNEVGIPGKWQEGDSCFVGYAGDHVRKTIKWIRIE